MDKKYLDKLVKSWIEGNLSESGSSEYEQNFWASEYIFKMVDSDPEQAWLAIDAIRQATDNDELLALLAAGHLEDLLVAHGKEFIVRFEELAKTDEGFRKLLGGVLATTHARQIMGADTSYSASTTVGLKYLRHALLPS